MSIAARLGRLNVDKDNEDARRLLDADKRINANASDAAAALDKVVALIKLDLIQEARQALKAGCLQDASNKPRAEALKAYINYRLDAKPSFKTEMEVDSGLKWPQSVSQLAKAQTLYRAGYLDAAMQAFKTADLPEDFAEDVNVNLSAIAALKGEKAKNIDYTQPAFDVKFNEAVSLLQNRQFAEALGSLSEAKQLAQDEEESYSAALQAAYVELQRGNKEAAESIFSSLHTDDLDTQQKAVYKLNKLALEAPTSFKEFLNATLSLPLDQGALIYSQRNALGAARLNLRLGLQQDGPLKRHRPQLLKHKSGDAKLELSSVLSNQLHPLTFFAQVHAKYTENQTESLKKSLKKRPHDVSVVFALAQALADNDQLIEAAKIISTFAEKYMSLYTDPDGKLYPGVAGAVIAANRFLGQTSLNELILGSIALKGNSLNTALTLASSASAENREKASNYFQSQPDAVIVAAGQLACGVKQFSEVSQLLDSVELLTSGVDVENLVAEGIAPLMRRATATKITSKPMIKKRKARTGLKRLPKDYDATKEPNPERWLAAQDRSNYKPKKKSGSQATQGAAEIPAEAPAAPLAKIKKRKGKR